MARGTGAARAWHPGPGSATAPPEAPRGLLYQRYRIDAAGIILDARIVPPTSQNQRAIEHDLVAAVQANLALDDSVLGRLSEQTIRNHDPCISCAGRAGRRGPGGGRLMCLGVLGEVVAVGDVAGVPIAHLRTETGPRRVSLLCLPDPVAPGDVVLVQFGHAVAVLDPEAAAAATAEAP